MSWDEPDDQRIVTALYEILEMLRLIHNKLPEPKMTEAEKVADRKDEFY